MRMICDENAPVIDALNRSQALRVAAVLFAVGVALLGGYIIGEDLTIKRLADCRPASGGQR